LGQGIERHFVGIETLADLESHLRAAAVYFYALSLAEELDVTDVTR
jgi:hypothetical protein